MQQGSGMPSHAFTFFRPRTLEEISQTYSWFADMRSHQPVFYNEELQLWQVFRYEDVITVLTDYNRFSSRPIMRFNGGFLRETLVSKDPPEHRKLRNLVNQAFTPRQWLTSQIASPRSRKSCWTRCER